MGAEMKKEMLDGMTADLMMKELRCEFNSGKTRTYQWRMDQLKGISRMIEDHEVDIVEALRMDLSKPEFESIITEISTVKISCKLALQKLRCWMKPKRVKTSLLTFPSSASVVSEPLGVVLVISAWNFPFLISLDPVIGAIAAGNAVVLKPSEIAPSTSALLAKLLQQYVDTTCIRVVEGSVDETRALLEQKWDKIFYTGSGRVGRIVMAAAAIHLTPVVLELGGKCPAVVDPNCDLKLAAKRIVAGKWGSNNGQTCISPDYLITTKDFAPKLIDAIKSALGRMYGKDLLGCQQISRVVNLQHFKRLNKLLDEEGVSSKIVVGGQSDEKLLRIEPTVLLDVPANSMIMTEEIFGPLLPIVTVERVEESFRVIQSKPKPLAAYLFTNSNRLKKKFVGSVSAGGMLVNDTILHFTLSSLPFGGVGESGMGSYHGKFSFDAFSHKKSVLDKSFHFDASVRYPPYTASKVRTFKALTSNSIFHKMVGLIKVSKDLLIIYYVPMSIGQPPRPFFLDPDTGSDLTWLQCDAPCVRCTDAPHSPYKPSNDLVHCKDPLCASLQSEDYRCENPEQCDYEVEYADGGSSYGVLVRDNLPLNFTNGARHAPHLAIGCGYDQIPGSSNPFLDGVLGLGKGKTSMVSQLHAQGYTRNIVGHCISGLGGGYIFFGDDVYESSRVSWTPMSRDFTKNYSPGFAELYFGGKATGVKNLVVIFDSGSSYTYFASPAYHAVRASLTKQLSGKPLIDATDDPTLPLCWRGKKPFKSIREVRKYFKPIALGFGSMWRGTARFELPPEGYLIVTLEGNVCLGILNGTEVGLQNYNVIGDISMQDRMVVYDNEKQMIGWMPANCDQTPKSKAAAS